MDECVRHKESRTPAGDQKAGANYLQNFTGKIEDHLPHIIFKPDDRGLKFDKDTMPRHHKKRCRGQQNRTRQLGIFSSFKKSSVSLPPYALCHMMIAIICNKQ